MFQVLFQCQERFFLVEEACRVAGCRRGLDISGIWVDSASLFAGCWQGTNYLTSPSFRFLICKTGFVILTTFLWKLNEITYGTEWGLSKWQLSLKYSACIGYWQLETGWMMTFLFLSRSLSFLREMERILIRGKQVRFTFYINYFLTFLIGTNLLFLIYSPTIVLCGTSHLKR